MFNELPIVTRPVFSGRLNFSLHPGLYFLAGGRAVGKSIFARALARYLRVVGSDRPGAEGGPLQVSYVYCYEPRSPQAQVLVSDTKLEDETVPFMAPMHFGADLKKHLVTLAQQRTSAAGSGVLILDSITLGLYRLGGQLSDGKGEATFKEGLQMRDVLAAFTVNQLATAAGVALIGVVNSELMPIISPLEGAVEGSIVVASREMATIRDRGASGRKAVELSIPTTFRDAAMKDFGYATTDTDDEIFDRSVNPRPAGY